MPITLTRLDPTGADRTALVDFVVGNTWPFHVYARRTRAEVEHAIDQGAYRDEDHDTSWVDHDELGRIGFVRFEDLSDDAPLFDLRLAEAARGRGLGVEVLRTLTTHVFTTLPQVTRFEGQTRSDNVAMRRTFERAGWVKEAHYRQAWPVPGGQPLDSVAYAMLRSDWESGSTTPVVWDDLPVERG